MHDCGVNMKKVNTNIEAMEEEIQRNYYEKIVVPFIPSLIKLQRIHRRNIEREKLRSNVHKLVCINRMYKNI